MDDPGKPNGPNQSDASRWANKIHEAFLDCKTKLSVVVRAVDAADQAQVGEK